MFNCEIMLGSMTVFNCEIILGSITVSVSNCEIPLGSMTVPVFNCEIPLWSMTVPMSNCEIPLVFNCENTGSMTALMLNRVSLKGIIVFGTGIHVGEKQRVSTHYEVLD